MLTPMAPKRIFDKVVYGMLSLYNQTISRIVSACVCGGEVNPRAGMTAWEKQGACFAHDMESIESGRLVAILPAESYLFNNGPTHPRIYCMWYGVQWVRLESKGGDGREGGDV